MKEPYIIQIYRSSFYVIKMRIIEM